MGNCLLCRTEETQEPNEQEGSTSESRRNDKVDEKSSLLVNDPHNSGYSSIHQKEQDGRNGHHVAGGRDTPPSAKEENTLVATRQVTNVEHHPVAEDESVKKTTEKEQPKDKQENSGVSKELDRHSGERRGALEEPVAASHKKELDLAKEISATEVCKKEKGGSPQKAENVNATVETTEGNSQNDVNTGESKKVEGDSTRKDEMIEGTPEMPESEHASIEDKLGGLGASKQAEQAPVTKVEQIEDSNKPTEGNLQKEHVSTEGEVGSSGASKKAEESLKDKQLEDADKTLQKEEASTVENVDDLIKNKVVEPGSTTKDERTEAPQKTTEENVLKEDASTEKADYTVEQSLTTKDEQETQGSLEKEDALTETEAGAAAESMEGDRSLASKDADIEAPLKASEDLQTEENAEKEQGDEETQQHSTEDDNTKAPNEENFQREQKEDDSSNVENRELVKEECEKSPPKKIRVEAGGETDATKEEAAEDSAEQEREQERLRLMQLEPLPVCKDYVSERIEVAEYGMREWKGMTEKSVAMRTGYKLLPEKTGLVHLRRVRGDNYCGVRSCLFQFFLRSNHLNVPSALEVLLQSPDLQHWTFANKFTTGSMEKIKEVTEKFLKDLDEKLNSLQNESDREAASVKMFNEDKLELMEAGKLLMLAEAIELYQQRDTNLLAMLLFARDTSQSLKDLINNHLNCIGDSGGIDQLELSLLGCALKSKIHVYHPSQHDKDDFCVVFPPADFGDLVPDGAPVLELLAEDDRHYNILLKNKEGQS